jgi:hypothetical protein
MAKKKSNSLEGKLNALPDKKIYININHLEKGDYELNIIHHKKIIVKTTFNKK